MEPYERLTKVFDLGSRQGAASLKPKDRELYRIQDFILEYEMNGLSVYFYNRLPDLDGIKAAIAAMRRHGLDPLAELLAEAAKLFDKYVKPKVKTTWSKELKKYDPKQKLESISDRIGDLDDYGLGESNIS